MMDAAALERRIVELENKEFESVETIFDGFTVTNVTETRTLDAATATLADLRNFVGTLVQDVKRRGANRAV